MMVRFLEIQGPNFREILHRTLSKNLTSNTCLLPKKKKENKECVCLSGSKSRFYGTLWIQIFQGQYFPSDRNIWPLQILFIIML